MSKKARDRKRRARISKIVERNLQRKAAALRKNARAALAANWVEGTVGFDPGVEEK